MSAAGWTPPSTAVGTASSDLLAHGPARAPAGARTAHADVRAANMSLILRHVQTTPSSRADLVRATGLSKATVSTLTGDLSARGLLREGSASSPGAVGRPSTTLEVPEGAVAGIGLEVGAGELAVTVLDLAGPVLAQQRQPLGPTRPASVVAQAAGLLAGHLERLRAVGCAVAGIGLAQPGLLDYSRGEVHYSSTLGWRDVPLLASLRRALGPDAPALLVENEAKLAAVAEYGRHAAAGVRDLLYLTGDQSVGAGIIADGRLLRGWHGFTGEVGHMALEAGGARCRCGRRGCWETLVGLDALAAALPDDDPAADPHAPVRVRTEALRERLDSGDRALRERLEQVRADLARGLAILVDVLNPQVIVLGGWIAAFAGEVAAPISQHLEARRLDGSSRVRLEAAELGWWAPSHGAALVALESVLTDPALMPRLAPERSSC